MFKMYGFLCSDSSKLTPRNDVGFYPGIGHFVSVSLSRYNFVSDLMFVYNIPILY